MNFKNIIVGISLILFGLSSCSEETAIDELNESTSEVQIVLSSVPAITKAGSQETEKPTGPELLIQNCVLGIYDKTDGKWISTQFISSLKKDEADNEHETYKVASNLKLMNNHAYTVMVIANVDENNRKAYEACKSFTDFESIKEGKEEYAFDASKLLKYGKVESFTVSPLHKRIEVPLDILAARIEFVINVKQDDNLKFDSTYYEMGVNLNIDDKSYTVAEIINAFKGANIGAYEMNNWGSLKDAPDGIEAPGKPQDGKLYYGDRPIIASEAGKGVKGVYIPNYKAVRVDKYKGKTIVIGDIYVKNVRTQAIAVCPAQEESMYTYPSKAVNKDDNLKKYFFYTYAKGKNTKTPLQVSFSGEIYEKNVLKKTPVTADWFALADVGTERVWGTTGEKEIKLETGWKGNSESVQLFFAMKDWKKDSSIEVPVESSNDRRLGSYDNSFFIKGEESEKIEYGHFYNVTATITDFSPQSTGKLDVIIQDYANNEIIVPPFVFDK